MNRQLLRISRLYGRGQLSQYLLLLACVAGVAGLLASRALVAISPLVGIAAVLANPGLRQAWRCYWRLRTVWFPALLYLFWWVSALYTSDWPVWRHEVYRQLPLLALPLAFGLSVPLSGRQRYGVGVLFTVSTALVALGTLGQYFRQYAHANELFALGQNLPSITGIFHIHFSVMLALAAFFGWLLGQQTQAASWQRWLAVGSAAVCVLVLHMLAYRTGLFVFYATLLLRAGVLVARRRWLLGAGLLVLLVLGPIVAYHTLLPVRNRVAASLYDLEQFTLRHDINDYSLSKRLAAWHTALAVSRQHPWVGAAPADVRQAMQAQYARQSFGLRPVNQVMVHNQYLHQLVGGGIVGLALWLLMLFGPMVQPGQWQNAYVYHFLTLHAVAMLTDSLLELQISFNLFIFCYGFLLVAAERRLLTASAADSA
ncbi:O-antigen ligase family protein [Hymenobacter sp. J193]|uniref:O-antigen ligase family protein n=1 Tax=Hymenobacter sp. J193 TaxID=2898429 RepID=UPI0021516207|nr:O-antigen ligase family protein [Hymenobacter sp. J193]MCR5888544.1 O-antigen ligase family protein [Hymenobacter sp. J193]